VLDLIARVILFNYAVAQREGLSGSDGQFLQLLRLHGPMTAGQLAEMTGLTTGSTTGVIDRLERAGFAHRSRDANDRRKVIVVPDEDAIGTRLAPHYTGQAERLDEVLRTRTAEELRVIADFLTELTSGPIIP
jgi:DNA-binding MarR family transcriptional regulator